MNLAAWKKFLIKITNIQEAYFFLNLVTFFSYIYKWYKNWYNDQKIFVELLTAIILILFYWNHSCLLSGEN